MLSTIATTVLAGISLFVLYKSLQHNKKMLEISQEMANHNKKTLEHIENENKPAFKLKEKPYFLGNKGEEKFHVFLTLVNIGGQTAYIEEIGLRVEFKGINYSKTVEIDKKIRPGAEVNIHTQIDGSSWLGPSINEADHYVCACFSCIHVDDMNDLKSTEYWFDICAEEGEIAISMHEKCNKEDCEGVGGCFYAASFRACPEDVEETENKEEL